jgi:hypothetical protein
MSKFCRCDEPTGHDDLYFQRLYSRKEQRLQHLKRKDQIDTDILFGFMEHPSPEKDCTVPEDLYYGILDVMIRDDENRSWEMLQLERWLDEYSGV